MPHVSMKILEDNIRVCVKRIGHKSRTRRVARIQGKTYYKWYSRVKNSTTKQTKLIYFIFTFSFSHNIIKSIRLTLILDG